ncbi:hypothetical protein BDV26DRAFT_295742 [Aspergillus bertholletiae]|uniref:T6SS Phospholipase effector Tle1-like catalytic domain-containing protein n=1 Tax=Aspergillus bertholletiae TaxID=1226010 RepID=A0A5N7AXX2_9EURO|nr:hypothetical protein BDV26DRAFT_295742 [Aspergillus bertholletiae]
MLDHSPSENFHYYQPGIGTHVAPSCSPVQRIKHKYLRIKDTVIGSSLGEHLRGGYEFLMQHYSLGDRIYLFGFGHGSYVARLLAEMLEYTGLLLAGDKEHVHLAWRTFAKWKRQRDGTEEKNERFQYLKAFRETFCRPITRIKFMGLFDSVNSVPWFELPWMHRSNFPYTPHTDTQVIRHAVAINERRAEYREDLILNVGHDGSSASNASIASNHHEYQPYRPLEFEYNRRSETIPVTDNYDVDQDSPSQTTSLSPNDLQHVPMRPNNSAGSNQDIQEMWFAGNHADIGGGYRRREGEIQPLSYIPLAWMVQEAKRTGLQFDGQKLELFKCGEGSFGESPYFETGSQRPEHLSSSSTSSQEASSDSTLAETHPDLSIQNYS